MNEAEREPGILVVDDEAVVGRTVKATREALTSDIVVARSGAEAVRVCKSRAFDLVISDMRMPGMDGVELLRLLAHDYPSMRRVILTGHAELEQTMAAINSGRVHRYLTKPCPVEDLVNAVRDELEAGRKERLEITRLREIIDNLSD